jgi:hypothetical protein
MGVGPEAAVGLGAEDAGLAGGSRGRGAWQFVRPAARNHAGAQRSTCVWRVWPVPNDVAPPTVTRSPSPVSPTWAGGWFASALQRVPRAAWLHPTQKLSHTERDGRIRCGLAKRRLA